MDFRYPGKGFALTLFIWAAPKYNWAWGPIIVTKNLLRKGF